MNLRVAIDARLMGTRNTGDTTYWRGLLHGWNSIDVSGIELLLFSNAPRPADVPLPRGARWCHVGGRSRWWSLVAFPLAARRLGAGVLHTQYTLSPLAHGGVTTIHDVSVLLGPEWFRPKDRLLLARSLPGTVRRARRVVTVSETSREEIEATLPAARGKVAVTPNACPPWIAAVPREEAEAMVRARFGVKGPYLLTVGTRWPRKNMGLAVAAVDGLPATFPHELLVTGKAGWGESELGSRGRAVGYVDDADMSALYSAASLYLAPSRHEGFGIPLLEAFRCGCPVLCSSGGALPEVAGHAARVEASWEPAQWTGVIQELLGDPSKLREMSELGRSRERAFDWAATARRTLDVYREAAA